MIFGFDVFEVLLGFGAIYLAWLLYMIEEQIRYSREVIDKGQR